MLFLSRILPPRLLRSVLAFRTVQKQRKQSGGMDGLSILVALVVGLREFRADRAEDARRESERRTTLDEVLRGKV